MSPFKSLWYLIDQCLVENESGNHKIKNAASKLQTYLSKTAVFVLFSPLLHPGHSLTQFVRHCADHFLNSEHKEIRMEAARTCSRLLTPSIHLISGHAHVVSQTAVQVVADVLSKLLVVGITDPGKAHRQKQLGESVQGRGMQPL